MATSIVTVASKKSLLASQDSELNFPSLLGQRRLSVATPAEPRCEAILDGGKKCFSSRILVETNFEASEILYLKGNSEPF